MAGSRIEKLGTIYSRLCGLLRSGALKEEDKPIWYNIYEKFPPLTEPCFKREVSEKEIPPIFYPEDVYRAKFYKKYGSPGIIDMIDTSSQQLSEQYIQIYQELRKKGNINDIDKATEAALLEKGIRLTGRKNVEKENIQIDKSREREQDHQEESRPIKLYSNINIKNEDVKEFDMENIGIHEALKLSISDEFKAASDQESIMDVTSLNIDNKTAVKINDDALKFIKSNIPGKNKHNEQQNREENLSNNKMTKS